MLNERPSVVLSYLRDLWKICNILLCKLILKHNATVSICLKDRPTSLETEANNSSTPIADASVTKVDTTAEAPFSTTNAIAGMYQCLA